MPGLQVILPILQEGQSADVGVNRAFSVADSWASFPLIFKLSKAFKTPKTSNLFIPNALQL